MKTLYYVVLFFFTNYPFAQGQDLSHKIDKKNYTGIHAGTFLVNGRQDSYSIINMLGVDYQRALYVNYTLGVSYSQWQKWPTRFDRQPVFEVLDVVAGQPRYDGLLRSRSDYKMIDLNANYRLTSIRKHSILLGSGFTYYWGTNYYYIDYDTINHVSYSLDIRRKGYFGTFLQANYRYSILKNLLSVDATIRQRYFFGLLPMETNVMIGIGVAF